MLILFFILPHIFAETCDMLYAPKKIQHLSTEISCANSSSLKDCQRMVFHKEINKDNKVSEAESCCGNEKKMSLVSPMTVAARKTLDQLKDVKGLLSNQYVNSIEDFYHHTQLHRKRVKKLGLELLKMYPEVFDGLTEQQVNLALAEHDRAKISGLAMADDKEQFYKKLYSGYQRSIDRPTIDKLNAIDEKYMQRAYEVIGLQETENMSTEYKKELQRKRKLLKLLENVADFVDRGMSPVSEEEFGRKMQLASEFMKDPKERELAAALEKRYKHIVKGLEYTPPNTYQYRAIKFSMLLDSQKEKLKVKFSSKQLSAMSILHKSITGTKKTLTEVLRLLASKAGMKLMMAADGVGLFFAGKGIGCSETLGHHDWIKGDGGCKPVEALTPKFIDFLNMPWEQQEHALKNEQYTCSILEKNFEDSQKAPQVDKCTNNEVVLSKNKLKLKVNSNNNGDITSIDILNPNGFLNNDIHGIPSAVQVNSNGELGNVCYRGINAPNQKNCINEESSYLLKDNVLRVKQMIQSASFEIQKARFCCSRKLNGTDVKAALRIKCNI